MSRTGPNHDRRTNHPADTMADDNVVSMIADFLNRPTQEIVLDAPLTSLVTDSFALVELAIHLQEELGTVLGHDDFEGTETVRQLVALFTNGVTSRTGEGAC